MMPRSSRKAVVRRAPRIRAHEPARSVPSLPLTEPDFSQLRYFKGSGWLGFGITGWGDYFSAPLFTEMYKKFGILRDEFAILASLYDCGTLSAKTICRITGRPKNSVSRGVVRLIRMGRIGSAVNPRDRREAILSLRANGRKLYERIVPLCRDRERQLLAGMSTDELVLIDKLLLKMFLLYHQSPEGIGLARLKQLGMPTEIDS